jgi:adenylate cyclase
MASIIVRQGVNEGLERELGDEPCVVGRDLRNQVCLTDLRVSRRHFQVEKAGNHFIVRNLSTTNGTFVGGEPIDAYPLQNHDLITIGDTILEFIDSRTSSLLELGGDDTVMWMDGDQDAAAEQGINYTISMRESSVRRFAESETDMHRLRALTERLAMLQELSNSLIQEIDEKRLLELLIDQIFATIRADDGYIFLTDDQQQRLMPIVARHRRAGSVGIENVQISRSLVHRAVNEKIGILSADTLSDERFKDQGSIILSGIRSALCVPMIVADEVLGIIHLDCKTAVHQFTQDDLKLLTMMSNQAAVSLRNARLRDRIVAEETQRKMLSAYVSPHLVERLLHEGFQEASRARSVEVSILFGDIRGFTKLSERLAPEQVMELLNTYCRTMADIVFRHNGSIDKYIGDCVMAVFGSPEPEPLHAQRAIECALAMQQAVATLRVGDAPIFMGIGVHTGQVVQGNIGSETMLQFTCVGDTVNTASRLCGVAGPGRVVVGEATLAQVRDSFEIEEMGEVELKGKREPMKTFHIIRPAQDRTVSAQ